MRLSVINTGNFKLDGGAMFGVVPKSIWKNINPPDDNNMCTWAMRCLLVETDNRIILIDNGIGDKQSEKFFSHYYLHGSHSLQKSLNNAGVDFADITDVFLTHLHFDHCGGSIKYDSNKEKLIPAFPNATYWSNEQHWKWATQPNAREKASFLKENILPVKESGQLKFVEKEGMLFENFHVKFVFGHTEAMMLPQINYKDFVITYMADLLPSAGHVPVAYVMAYDVRPLQTLKEKYDFATEALQPNHVLFFEHDPQHECATLMTTDKGARVEKTFSLSEIL